MATSVNSLKSTAHSRTTAFAVVLRALPSTPVLTLAAAACAESTLKATRLSTTGGAV